MLGCVVVGVGIAGRVRLRDLQSPLPGSVVESLKVKGFVSRRPLEEVQGVKQISLEEALSRDDVQVAFVCTENSTHEEHIRRFLEAGKHVCVEYPMTLDYQSAAALWDLADQKGVVLHEEHIELLTPDFKQLKKDIAGLTLEEASLHFTGGPVKPGSGFPAFSGIARLTWLVDLFGELSVTRARLEEEQEGRSMKMTAHMLTKDNKPLTWIEERSPSLGRTKRIDFLFSSGRLTELPVGQREEVGLFMQDMLLFGHKLATNTSPAHVTPVEVATERRRILHCMQLAEQIRKLSQEP